MIMPRVVRNDLTLLLLIALYEISIERSGFMGLILTDCWVVFPHEENLVQLNS